MYPIADKICDILIYAICTAIIITCLNTIYTSIVREKVFNSMDARKWTILFCGILAGMLYLKFLNFVGGDQLLYKEELSNLTRQEGILQISHSSKSTTYYLKVENGESYKIVFLPALDIFRFSEYENKSVTIWKKGKYVYQMETNERVVVDVNESNDRILSFNCARIAIDLWFFWMGLLLMFGEMNKTPDKPKEEDT